MKAALVSTYELGHQPLHVASPATALLAAGHEVRCLDLSVEPWDDQAGALVDWADIVCLSVPMHTAMRLALQVARATKDRRPELPVCFYGLYAAMSADLTVGRLADQVIVGEYEPALVSLVSGLASSPVPGDPETVATGSVRVELARGRFGLPARHLLPPLDRYAHLSRGDEHHLVGYVEASHGCVHRCRHCPIPAVYDGRTRLVGQDVLLADVEQLWSMGARHLTFGDPDFLNGPHHSQRVIRAVHSAFPDLTFDCTAKVEHLLRHRDLFPELAAAGCLFVVSAVESMNESVLRTLDKGHTAADAALAVDLLRSHGIELRPSFLPFTPWTSVDDVVDILDFVAQKDLVANVDPVQYGIRLLLPEGSLLLGRPELAPHLGPYDPEGLTWTWSSPDPEVDALQSRLAGLAEQAAATGQPLQQTWDLVVEEVAKVKRVPASSLAASRGTVGEGEGRPRLSEPWFC
ncbi:MAG: radical SAM protein [Acidimicrobiales bacterium]|nr:radical SAM protein [Acidimicrobiales bacterium]